MKKILISKLLAATLAISSLGIAISSNAQSSLFGSADLDQSKFVVTAIPSSSGNLYQLVIIEQVSSTRSCWSESGSNPTIVNPLLLQFDFSGICGRATDSNGYSIRMGGQDLGVGYSFSFVRDGNDLVMVGSDPFNQDGAKVEIGRTRGLSSSPMKVFLNPGWRLTRRTYEGSPLGHIYLTNNRTLNQVIADGGGPNPTPTPTPSPSPSPSPTPTPSPSPSPSPSPTPTPRINFPDITNDIYVNEIIQAVNLGIISGFEDNTFRPQLTLTREQLVSMVFDGISKNISSNVNLPVGLLSNPYPDVAINRWSAAKIQWAKNNQIVSGYEDGSFRPGQPVTRAELIAVQRRAAEYSLTLLGRAAQITPRQTPVNFTDMSGHWAAGLASQMSGYCKVASPVNEVGTVFAPNTASQRNYAAAATLRMINCVKTN